MKNPNKAAGARAAHHVRVEKTEQQIRDAIEQLKSLNIPVTKSVVASMIGISAQQVIRRYGYLFKEKLDE